MHRFFTEVYFKISKHKLPWLLGLLAILGLCFLCINKINFEEDISQIIPKSDKADITAKVLKQQNFSDKVIVITEKKNASQDYALSETADDFLEKIEPLKPYISDVQGKVDDEEILRSFHFISENLPIFLEEKDYEIISQKLNSDSISQKISDNFSTMLSPTSVVTKDFIRKDPLGFSAIALKKLNSLNSNSNFQLEDNYVVSENGRHLLLFIEPKFGGSETKNNEKFAEGLEKIRGELNQKYRGTTEISYFGAPLIAVANAKQIKHDIQSTVLVSMALLLLLLIFYFKNWLTPLIIFIPTAVSAVISLAIIYFIKDRISAVSLSISAILVGLTVDYALHILTHYKHKTNIAELYREITQPVLMSAATTAVSFLCLVFVRSEALKDLGIFAAITVMLSAIFSLIIIPQIYRPKAVEIEPKKLLIDKVAGYPFERNKFLIISCLITITVCLFGFSKVKFNSDISDLNFVPEEMQQSEAKLQSITDLAEKSVYVFSYGNSAEEALKHNTKVAEFLRQEKSGGNILNFTSSGEILIPESLQVERITRWKNFWDDAKKAQTIAKIKSAGKTSGFSESAFSEFEEVLYKNYQPLQILDFQELPALRLNEFLTEEDGLATLVSIVKLDEKKRGDFISAAEKIPNTLVIDRQQMNENFLGLLKDDFLSLINYSLIAIIAIFLLFFRNLGLTIFAIIPVLLSGIVTAGIFYFLGLELNIFSTIVCTLVFGAGVDFNIFLTKALQKELSTGKSALPTYRVSIVLALITTLLAIGSLIFAKHPALKSVAAVATLGMLSVVIISFTIYPLIFRLIRKRTQKGLQPVSSRVFLNSVFSLIYYALGGFFFSILAMIFGKNAQRILKVPASKFLVSVLYTNPFVRKKFIPNPSEDFSRPVVIIANHTSFLDTLAMAMVTPKIVYLVNDWVYNSPIFGKVVKRFGFYPVSEGIENGHGVLQEKINQGYSLAVFPEAQRSETNRVQRFHKGAFYLAEKYGLDVVPVFIHGNSEVMPKGDFMIHDGKISVKVGDRISADDKSFGENYSERTKKIQQFYREKFQEFRNEIEDENYFKPQIYSSFLYKEREISEEAKRDFEENKSAYFEMNRLISADEKILHFCGDFGQIDMLLALSESARKIHSVIPDENRRNVASENFVVKKRKVFYHSEIPENKHFTTLIISDENFPEISLPESIRQIIIARCKNNGKFTEFSAALRSEKITVLKR
ncbi:hypothetical protein SAMN05443429_104167 [Cruoricaptor ignavus]|uniref:SSD domain-containing protein n=1 Tax=Cruoricaptor ignavus TaxID=1118202 RepID=A0A1M6E065_9FLAO|nr:MMPL family transporter [Cruoricaptor ignavus]SHI78770.1 hypothetical protein SAMN05443429_104167 [Cruoricaptor ignavus]